MGQLKPATTEMFEEVYSSLLRRHDPTIPKEKWRTIFEPSWRRPTDGEVGYVLTQEDRIVGFLGLIKAQRHINGILESFVNVTSWITEGGAGQGALLVLPLRELQAHTVTNLTSTPFAYRVFRRIGFEVLETHYRIIPTLQRRTGTRWEVTEDDQEIIETLTPSDVDVYRDHLPHVRQLVARRESRYCHLVFSAVQRRGISFAKVHHFGGPGAPAEAIADIGRYLLKEGILAFDCDDRLISPLRNRWSVRRKLDVPRLYRSDSLSPREISELYSELVLLGMDLKKEPERL